MKIRFIAAIVIAVAVAVPVAPDVASIHADGNAVPATAAQPITLADLGSLDHGGIFAHPITPGTPAQMADHAHRLAAYGAVIAQSAQGAAVQPNGDPGNYGGKSGSVQVGLYPEPNTADQVNSCGPSASRVVISNWTSNVPSLTTMEAQENAGTAGYLSDLSQVVGPINQDANTGNFYLESNTGAQGTFNNYVGADIYGSGHPLMTSLVTVGNNATLAGWSRYALHIVAIYGFNFVTAGAGTINYEETSGWYAGTSATGYNSFPANGFWSLVSLNSEQVW